jgi:hypothetical protein
MLPPAPARLSMITGGPSPDAIRETTVRATTSTPEPGGQGTTTRIDRDG